MNTGAGVEVDACRGRRAPPPARPPIRRTSAPSPAYGNVYVAQISLGANDRQATKGCCRGGRPGPSLVIAYSTCIAHGIDMSVDVAPARRVKSGYWPLYRFQPSREDGAHPFRLDASAPTIPVKAFIGTETRFAVLERTHPRPRRAPPGTGPGRGGRAPPPLRAARRHRAHHPPRARPRGPPEHETDAGYPTTPTPAPGGSRHDRVAAHPYLGLSIGRRSWRRPARSPATR